MGAKSAAQREADGDTTVDIEWRGRTLTIPSSLEHCDVSVLEAFEEGKGTAAVRGILGPKVYASLKPMTVADLGELSERIAVVLGFASAGE